MLKKRRKYSAQFKFEIALEAAKELRTITELSSEHGVHPNQIGQWKRQLLEQGAEVFSKSTADRDKKQEAVQAELFEQIGRLKMELEWLKKKSTRIG
jgi:putative transposase